MVDELGRPMGLSPDGLWYLYLTDETVRVRNVASGEVTDLSSIAGVDFVSSVMSEMVEGAMV